MKILWTSVIPVLSLVAGTALAANVCEPKALEFKGLEDRSVEIAFPDGKRVIIVGEIHGAVEINQLVSMARDHSQSKDQFVRNIAIINARQADAIEHSRANMQFLILLRSKYPDVKMVAMEGSAETAAKLKDLFPKILGLLETRAEAIGVGAESVQEVLLPALGAHLYLHAKVPQVLAGIELTGVESDVAIAAEKAAYQLMGVAGAKFRAQAGSRTELIAKEGEMIDFLLGMYGAEDRRAPEGRAKIRAKMEQDFPTELHTAIAEVITAELMIGDYRERRDEHSATQLASRKTSSVFVVGRDHLKALTAKLTRKCLGR